MGTHKLTGNKQFYVALTERRLVLSEINSTSPMRAFERKDVSIAAKRKKWTDVGNMKTTISEGYEVDLKLPNKEAYTFRLYETNAYDPQHAGNVATLLERTGVA